MKDSNKIRHGDLVTWMRSSVRGHLFRVTSMDTYSGFVLVKTISPPNVPHYLLPRELTIVARPLFRGDSLILPRGCRATNNTTPGGRLAAHDPGDLRVFYVEEDPQRHALGQWCVHGIALSALRHECGLPVEVPHGTSVPEETKPAPLRENGGVIAAFAEPGLVVDAAVSDSRVMLEAERARNNRLSDECGKLKSQVGATKALEREVLAENAELRRTIERLKREAKGK